jgi:4-hydroxyphenylpyruvate dioxygenase-like putative hemolysin
MLKYVEVVGYARINQDGSNKIWIWKQGNMSPDTNEKSATTARQQVETHM